MNSPAWQRWTLFVALFALGIGYVVAYVFFRANSRDFVAERFNQRSQVYARNHPIGIPTKLTFTSGNADVALLGSGWYPSGPEGTWSSMDDSWVALPLRRHSAIGLKIFATAFVARHHKEIDISADIDGQALGKWRQRWSDAAPASFDVCAPASESRIPKMLHIHFDHIASPLHVGVGPDGRSLGLLLGSIEFTDGCRSAHSN
jgi:hypothetical protein